MDILTDLNTAFELEDEKPRIAFLPVGATEQHSRHLPLATDTLLGDRLSAELVRRVDRPGAMYLLRTLPFSSSAENMGFRGTVNFTPMTMRAIVRDTFESLGRSGIEQLVVCPWHGGNFILKPVVRELNLELGRCGAIYLNPWEHVPAAVYAKFAPGFEVHGGDVETSAMLALWPDTVRADRRDNPVPFQAMWLDMFSMKTLSGGEGHAGHPTRATAEKGREFADAVVTHAAQYLTTILAMADRFAEY
jgi:creatinine amidohydrolase